MKKITIIIITLACFAPAAVLAGVAGSDHDLTGSGEKLCFACHIPHNALGSTLWASTPSGTFTGVQDLCYTCHDGSVTTLGSTTAFNTALEQHLGVGGDCSADNGCHDVHNQNPNTTGKFIQSTVTLTNGSYCEPCHDATPFPGAEGLGDKTAGVTHFTNGTTFTCNQCHSIHGATPQTTNPVGLTNPVLLADNQPGAFYGAFCISCHNGTAPAEAATGSGGVAATDVHNYANDVLVTSASHPTTTTAGGTPVGGCNKCHDVHDHTLTDYGYLLMEDNANSAYCVSCHSAGSAPAVGANTHYVGIPADVNMNSGLTPALPWANQIDEDGTAGADFATATANNMVCETCHSVHKQGYVTAPQYNLRDANGANNEICSACHTDN